MWNVYISKSSAVNYSIISFWFHVYPDCEILLLPFFDNYCLVITYVTKHAKLHVFNLLVTYCLSKSYRYSNTWCPSKYYMYLITGACHKATCNWSLGICHKTACIQSCPRVTLLFSGRQTIGSHSNKGDNCIISSWTKPEEWGMICMLVVSMLSLLSYFPIKCRNCSNIVVFFSNYISISTLYSTLKSM